VPDGWLGSYVTTQADLAPFFEQDVSEATNRLRRLAAIWRLRLTAISQADLDQAEGTRTRRASSSVYAEAVHEPQAAQWGPP
jgi:hypothetical protein